jgi:hypothetical protein
MKPAALGLTLLALAALPPLFLREGPADFFPPFSAQWLAWALPALVGLALAAALAYRAFLDRAEDPAAGRNMLLFAALAAGMTLVHWAEVDRDPVRAEWQARYYLGILDHSADAPHRYRPLPYGFTRLVEWLTRDWSLACLLYRWFFMTWFVWAAYRLARLVLPPGPALLTLLPLALLYPLSVLRYFGQLTDPLSHFLLVLGLVYALEDRPWALAGALALGMLAKETAVLLVPTYFGVALVPRGGEGSVGGSLRDPTASRSDAATGAERLPRALLISSALGLVATGAFLAARMPLGWRPGFGALNGTTGLMAATNLGLTDEPVALTGVPLIEHYLHPILFVGLFLPPIVWGWRRIPARVRAACAVLVPLLLVCNLCFGWLYESRNYLPAVPLLATAALCAMVRDDKP